MSVFIIVNATEGPDRVDILIRILVVPEVIPGEGRSWPRKLARFEVDLHDASNLTTCTLSERPHIHHVGAFRWHKWEKG